MLWESYETASILESILNSIDEAIHVVNSEGMTIFYNEVASKHDGVNRQEVLGKHILDIFPSLNRETSTLLKVIESGKPIYQHPQTYKNNKGQLIDTVNTTLPIILNGSVIGAVEIAKDLSTVKQLSQKILDLQAKVLNKKSKPQLVSGAKYHWNDIITNSPRLKKIKQLGEKAANTSSPVIVYGPTGTGKELFVQAIHNSSPRKKHPFIVQNCAALPTSLLDSILFGTNKGSFTGAIDRPGLFELAHGGTLFLDEMNSMDLEVQTKVLRVLEDGVICRVGGTKNYQVDVRIIVAMNEHPLSCLEKNIIRPDLYYRLNVFFFELPSLRERKEDIPILVNHFIQKYNSLLKKQVNELDDSVLAIFEPHSWEGNIRELEHTIEYAVNMTEDRRIKLEDLPPSFHLMKEKRLRTSSKTKSFKEVVKQTEIQLITNALAEVNGNVMRAAQLLELPRQTLQYKMKKYHIHE